MVDEKKEKEPQQPMFSKRDVFFIALSFVVVFTFFFLPTPSGLTHEGQVMIGILVMAAVLWITEPIPLAVSGLLIMVLQPILGAMTAEEVFSSFGNKAVFFLIGAFMLAAAIEKHGLHRRIALKFLSFFEHNPRVFTFGIMVSCACLSFIMPEHGVAALFLPIVVSILVAMKLIPKQSNFGKVSMLCVAYGCSIGSLGTLIGGARNPLTIGVLSDLTPAVNITFFEWMSYSMPVVFLSLPLVWLILQLVFPLEITDVTEAKKEINKQVTLTGSISGKEKAVLGILALTVVLWILFSSHQYFGLAAVAILSAVLLFLTGAISWKDVEQRVPWGIILLYGGAITLGIGVQETQAGAWIAHLLFTAVGDNVYLVLLIMIVFAVLLTNVMSNIGAVAILLPIGIAIAGNIEGISPLLASMTIALCGGLAFMLVIATPGNAITYSSGYFSTNDLFKAGSIANVLCIIVIFLVAVFYWMGVLGL
ncbi:MAG: DASS family sodium-coupled anion symporter [Candidatus Thermoplasmatota archaeon]|nr:DASS family sodium-coupled anion symporter [Candidatus Thermoplasmatota archaeon]